MDNRLKKLLKSEIIAFIISFLVYVLIFPLKNIDKGYIIFIMTVFLSLIASSKVYYSKYKLLNYKAIFITSVFSSILITIIKDFFMIGNHYFILFLLVSFLCFYIFILKKEFSIIKDVDIP